MKKLSSVTALLIACFIAGVYFSSCIFATTADNKNDTVNRSKINIPATTGLMEVYQGYDEHYKRKRITAAERRELEIDGIEEVRNHPNREIAKGKELYKGDEGRIATFLVIQEDYATFEFLASYSPDGKVIDCIRVGTNMAYSSDEEVAIIEGNSVKCLSSWGEPGESSEVIAQIYTITDELHFSPFAWPPSAFPCEIPFMTYETFDEFGETEGASLYCKILSVVCTGASGNQYALIINGKAKQDAKVLKAEQRTFLLEPLNSEGQPAGEAIKAVMPAVGEDETFEIKVKGLTAGKNDANLFSQFNIRR